MLQELVSQLHCYDKKATKIRLITQLKQISFTTTITTTITTTNAASTKVRCFLMPMSTYYFLKSEKKNIIYMLYQTLQPLLCEKIHILIIKWFTKATVMIAMR